MPNAPRRQGPPDEPPSSLSVRLDHLEDWRKDTESRFQSLSDRHCIIIGGEAGDTADEQRKLALQTREAIAVAADILKARTRRGDLAWKAAGALLLGLVAMLVPILGKPILNLLGNAAHMMTTVPK